MFNTIKNVSFETWTSLISCITSMVALFLGDKAYNKYKVITRSFNDKKEYRDYSEDESQKAGHDIINYGMNSEQF